MPLMKYKNIRLRPVRLKLIKLANQIIESWMAQGYRLTLRQLYYRFIALDLFPDSWRDKKTGSKNNERSYKRLGDLVAEGRLAGLIDWAAIEDRTRALGGEGYWGTPADIVRACAAGYRIDKWAQQNHRVEVWVEKDAMEGIIAKAATEIGIGYFSCRGYTSVTSMWEAGNRLRDYARAGFAPVILHLGDHDPSGWDMSRDIEERIKLFMKGNGSELDFLRIALNMDQIEEYKPPPSPAKVTDSRYKGYSEQFGDDCWELDSLEPNVVHELIQRKIRGFISDKKAFEAAINQEEKEREQIGLVADNWDKVIKHVTPKPKRKRRK